MAFGVPQQRNPRATWARDFILTFVAALLVAAAFGHMHASAIAASLPADGAAMGLPPPAAAAASYAVVASNPLKVLNGLQAYPIPPYVLISLSVAFLCACNLALLRHLREAYARPERKDD